MKYRSAFLGLLLVLAPAFSLRTVPAPQPFLDNGRVGIFFKGHGVSPMPDDRVFGGQGIADDGALLIPQQWLVIALDVAVDESVRPTDVIISTLQKPVITHTNSVYYITFE